MKARHFGEGWHLYEVIQPAAQVPALEGDNKMMRAMDQFQDFHVG
jgi:hypothetical protein